MKTLIALLLISNSCWGQYTRDSNGNSKQLPDMWYFRCAKGTEVNDSGHKYLFVKDSLIAVGYTIPKTMRPTLTELINIGVVVQTDICPHIYVAVMPDTVVWDKAPVWLSSGSVDDLINKPSTSAKPHTQKIVCIACHKITEQAVKVVNDTIALSGATGPEISLIGSNPVRLLFKGDTLTFDTTVVDIKLKK